MRRPLSVVGTDHEALQALLSLHACPEPRILDVTHNVGVMWRRLPYRPVRSDRDALLFEQGHTDLVADFRALPVSDASYDVIVFDPPHMTDATTGIHGGRPRNSREGTAMGRYGVTATDYQGQLDITFTFDAFLTEARRVLVPRSGVVLAKIADQIHGNAYRWQARTLQNKAEAVGFCCCDLMLRASWERAGLIDPRWKHINHVRQVHTYWLVLRNGPDCFSPTAPLADVKPRAADMFEGIANET